MSVRITACTSCRQTKLKCDVKETQPDPCTRCRTRNLSCKMDSNFKRIPTRGKLAEVTQKLNTLQEILANDPNHRIPANADLATISGNSAHSPYPSQASLGLDSSFMSSLSVGIAGSSRSSLGTFPSPPPISNLDVQPKRSCFYLDPQSVNYDALSMEPKQLRDVRVDGQTICALFTHYYHFRHRHLPVINTDITVTKLYDASPFLFWTILHISCRQNPDYDQLENDLTAPYKELLATTLLKPVTSLQTIQALLLLCIYPFNIRHQHEEHSLNLCGFALSACLQMGLHHPDRLQDYGVLNISESSIESRMTWMALFQISTFQSFTLGTPPLIQSAAHLEGIRSMCCNLAIPRAFAAQIEIQRHVSRYTSTLDGQTDLQSRFSLTEVFDRELDTLRSDFAEAWTAEAECNLLIAKLYLYSMFISPKSKSETNLTGMGGPYDTIGPLRRTIRHLGLATVVRLVAVFKTQCGYSQSEKNNMFADKSSNIPWGVEFYPKFYFRSLVFTACFLIYFLLTDERPTPEDEKTARDHIDAIHDIFREYHLKFMNYTSLDVHGHATETIAKLRRAMSGESKFEKFTVESRMGASIFFGAMRTVNEAQRREALNARHMQLHQTMQEPSTRNTESSSALPVDLENDFFWEQQLSAEWNIQWGIYPFPDFQFGAESGNEFNNDMDGAFP